MNVVIAVVAYNRPKSLERLLTSINKSATNSEADLVISIDFSGDNKCEEIANNFEWNFGEKKIISHKKNLGLRNHILSVGDLVSDYDALMLLEDDIFVSPGFLEYFIHAVTFVRNDEKIAGIALYKFEKNLINWLPFSPIEDGYDNFYMQVPCSWGQGWTKSQWLQFKNWYNDNLEINIENSNLPSNVIKWPESSWLKYYYLYLQNSNKYFFYPMGSYATNMGDVGTHHKQKVDYIATNLSLAQRKYNFIDLKKSLNIYDSYFELELSDNMKAKLSFDKSTTIDLYGEKRLTSISSKYLISIKRSSNPLEKIELSIFPLQFNILLKIKNNSEINLHYGLTKYFEEELRISELPVRISPSMYKVIEKKGLNRGKQIIMNSKKFKLGNILLKPLEIFRIK